MAAGVTTTAITAPEGRFAADVAGAAGAPLVLLLHGFRQSRHSWREQIPALSAAGDARSRSTVHLITIVTARLHVKTRQPDYATRMFELPIAPAFLRRFASR